MTRDELRASLILVGYKAKSHFVLWYKDNRIILLDDIVIFKGVCIAPGKDCKPIYNAAIFEMEMSND